MYKNELKKFKKLDNLPYYRAQLIKMRNRSGYDGEGIVLFSEKEII